MVLLDRNPTARGVVYAMASAAFESPPTEFLIFRAGVNATTKGDFVFDAAAAAEVLAAYSKQGVRLAIDLEHASLTPAARANRSDASDARGWFDVELRGGELWAVNVTWTPDGERRLAERTQCYISPAFLSDDAGRICELINVALVSQPATHQALPLVAASRGTMDPELIMQAIKALKEQDADAALALLEQLISEAAGAASEPEPPAEGDALAGAPDGEEPPAALGELSAVLASAFGTTEAAQIGARLGVMIKRIERFDRDVAAVELGDRRSAIADLVRLGAETPATAWSGDPSKRVPVARLAGEPLPDLRRRVELLSASRPGAIRAPMSGAPAQRITDADRAGAVKLGITIDDFLARKARALKPVRSA